MKNAYSFRFYYRVNEAHCNSLAKVEVHDGHHWQSGKENVSAYEKGTPLPVAAMLQRTFGLLPVSDGKLALERFLGRKQVFLDGVDLPLRDLDAFGWETIIYPKKYVPVDGQLAAALLEDARTTGLDIDAGNEVSCLTGRVFKSVVDLLSRHGVPLRLYLDSGTMNWLKATGAKCTHEWLSTLKENPTSLCRLVESPEGCPADSLILSHSDREGCHVCSQDNLDDYDMQYDWVLHGAERGWPRIHKIVKKGDFIGLPDFGLWTSLSDTQE